MEGLVLVRQARQCELLLVLLFDDYRLLRLLIVLTFLVSLEVAVNVDNGWTLRKLPCSNGIILDEPIRLELGCTLVVGQFLHITALRLGLRDRAITVSLSVLTANKGHVVGLNVIGLPFELVFRRVKALIHIAHTQVDLASGDGLARLDVLIDFLVVGLNAGSV